MVLGIRMNFSNEFKTALTAYLFVATPFFILIVVKILSGRYEDILLTGDWAIASAMMFSTSYFNVKNALNRANDINKVGLDLYLQVTLILAFISIAIYVVLLLQPKNYPAAVAQVLIFLFATINFIKYSRLTYRLKGGV